MSVTARLSFAALLAMNLGYPALAYDAVAGRQKAEAVCAACHGKEGRSQQATVPSLAGQHNDYIVLALYQFRAGHRPSLLMAPIGATLTDTDLGNLAAYYSALRFWSPERGASTTASAAGPALTQQRNCLQCHGPGLAGQDSVPRIAGQKIDYLKAQLRAFRAGNRGDIDGNMTSAASQLTDGEIDALADYVSALARRNILAVCLECGLSIATVYAGWRHSDPKAHDCSILIEQQSLFTMIVAG